MGVGGIPGGGAEWAGGRGIDRRSTTKVGRRKE